jgi:hypothetical protein
LIAVEATVHEQLADEPEEEASGSGDCEMMHGLEECSKEDAKSVDGEAAADDGKSRSPVKSPGKAVRRRQSTGGGGIEAGAEDGNIRSPDKAVRKCQTTCGGGGDHSSCADDADRSLRSLMHTLDYVCEDEREGPAESLWHSKQERSAWLAEVQAPHSVCAALYLLRCLRFALQEHLE